MYAVWYRFVLDYVNVPTIRIVKRLCAGLFGLCTSDPLQHLHLKNIYPLFGLHSLAFLKLPVQMSLTICEKPLSQINYIENIPSTSEWKYVYLNVYLQNASGVLTYRTRLIHFLQWWVGSRKKWREHFQLPCFNPRQQAKLLKSSFTSNCPSFDLFYDLL